MEQGGAWLCPCVQPHLIPDERPKEYGERIKRQPLLVRVQGRQHKYEHQHIQAFLGYRELCLHVAHVVNKREAALGVVLRVSLQEGHKCWRHLD